MRRGGRRTRARRAAEEAEGYAVLLGLARVGWGGVQVLAPGLIDRYLTRRTGRATTPAWRMKGVRDVFLGLGAVSAPDRQALETWTRIGAYVDLGDTLATSLDRGRVLRPSVTLLGSVGGLATLVAALAITDALRGPR